MTISGQRTDRYNISGDYQREQLNDLLTEGRTVTIKWYKNEPFWTFLAEEIYVDGEKIITYNNDTPVEWKLPLILGICLVALGTWGFLLMRSFLKMNRTKQQKRDEKIKRKYGTEN